MAIKNSIHNSILKILVASKNQLRILNTILRQPIKFYFSVQVFLRLHSSWDQTFHLHHTTASLSDDDASSPSCQYNPRTTQVVKRLWCGKRREPQTKQASGPELQVSRQVSRVGTMEGWGVCRA